MIVRTFIILVLLALSAFLSQAWAFAFFVFENSSLVGKDQGVPVVWHEQSVAFGIGITDLNHQIDIIDALDEWNSAGTNIDIVQGQNFASPCAENDALNSIGLTQNNCGLAWGDAIGLTQVRAISTPSETYIIETDIRLRDFASEPNNHWTQSTDPLLLNDRSCYPNNQGGITCEFYRVVLHELGHAIGLEHPDEVGQQVDAVMNSGVTSNATPRNLSADDINGAKLIYENIGSVVDGRSGVVTSDSRLQRDKVSSGSWGLHALLFLFAILVLRILRKQT